VTVCVAVASGGYDQKTSDMATNKNQHFVPRCYLRPFTLDSGGLAITLLNIDRMKFVEGAPVKHQCSGDYFYGEDLALEKAHQMIRRYSRTGGTWRTREHERDPSVCRRRAL